MNKLYCYKICKIQTSKITAELLLIEISRFLANVNSRSRSLYAIDRPSVCRLSVTLVHPTQPVEIFRSFSSPFGTLAIL